MASERDEHGERPWLADASRLATYSKVPSGEDEKTFEWEQLGEPLFIFSYTAMVVGRQCLALSLLALQVFSPSVRKILQQDGGKSYLMDCDEEAETSVDECEIIGECIDFDLYGGVKMKAKGEKGEDAELGQLQDHEVPPDMAPKRRKVLRKKRRKPKGVEPATLQPMEPVEPVEEVQAQMEPVEEAQAQMAPLEEVQEQMEPVEEVQAQMEPLEEVQGTESVEPIPATEPTEQVQAMEALEPAELEASEAEVRKLLILKHSLQRLCLDKSLGCLAYEDLIIKLHEKLVVASVLDETLTVPVAETVADQAAIPEETAVAEETVADKALEEALEEAETVAANDASEAPQDANDALEAAWAQGDQALEPGEAMEEKSDSITRDPQVDPQIALLEEKVQEAMRRTARAQLQHRRKKAEELLLTGLLKHLKAACKVYTEEPDEPDEPDEPEPGDLQERKR
eukprot:Skav204392  [mRNA]  locus=scaffold2947:90574:98233:+ [translate_table: standard]